VVTTSPLGNPAQASLTGPHAYFAERKGRTSRYPVDVCPFVGLPDDPGPQDWADLAALSGAGTQIALAGIESEPPAEWEITWRLPGVQLADDGVAGAPDSEAKRLTAADVPEMLALVEQTRPGPFLTRTIEMGTYLGIRRAGRLVAMAGERLHPPGWTEISAVCTDADFRGLGLATRLIHALVHQIRERDEKPFLHTAATNTNAIRLYRSLGFHLRHEVSFVAARTPVQADQAPSGVVRA
jgi:ribosomal protein S18 acetylase RimI-like enzyme